MNNILVIGAGGVSSVTVHKMAGLPDTFNNITLASRTLKKCKSIQTSVKNKFNIDINIAELDADNVNDTVNLIKKIDLNLPLFIARRMRFNPKHKGSVSVQIIKIAKLAVALGMAMILIAVSTGKGLQKEIQDKTVAFNGRGLWPDAQNTHPYSLANWRRRRCRRRSRMAFVCRSLNL